MRRTWRQLEQVQAVRTGLVVLGALLMALAPIVGVLPGPAGIPIFAAGATLMLRYSGWAKRAYVKFKRKHPNKGRWADWSMRRRSARQREERQRANGCFAQAAPERR